MSKENRNGYGWLWFLIPVIFVITLLKQAMYGTTRLGVLDIIIAGIVSEILYLIFKSLKGNTDQNTGGVIYPKDDRKQ